mmetsp:Transcript_14855/g.21915  ORF Transcript_14855/g.21915 Transcript_14855/m.21915 type:complete len:91 (+) Transcript_14855:567-839(+)|eukprot:CAMPEP_0194221548 /NCGR_PEP_ID=MMETSP0156-20130528/30837_1 /TAXON_ID=33649 /ORGANISM="Thalassionema nitzschioides, Strain L26-B" /LENGTH=90 /DNA_ID=CAMNT_0038951991 /DNA_START=510 /DNA_END=782 /DNA_ORIENTATION=+
MFDIGLKLEQEDPNNVGEEVIVGRIVKDGDEDGDGDRDGDADGVTDANILGIGVSVGFIEVLGEGVGSCSHPLQQTHSTSSQSTQILGVG